MEVEGTTLAPSPIVWYAESTTECGRGTGVRFGPSGWFMGWGMGPEAMSSDAREALARGL